jgi:hypothetical protein
MTERRKMKHVVMGDTVYYTYCQSDLLPSQSAMLGVTRAAIITNIYLNNDGPTTVNLVILNDIDDYSMPFIFRKKMVLQSEECEAGKFHVPDIT